MFSLPKAAPDDFIWSNAQCLLRTWEDVLMVIDDGYHYGYNSTAFFIGNYSVSTYMPVEMKLELY